MHGNTTEEYLEIGQTRKFEVQLWQRLNSGPPQTDTNLINNPTDRPFNERNGEYVDSSDQNMAAIGVSCHSSSSVGSADIDGLRSTYSNFEQSDTPIPAQRDECAKQFGGETLTCTLDISKDGWLKWLFDSIGLPSPLDASAREGDVMGNMRFNAQLEYLQADNLRKLLLQAYSTYAIKLMYNDGRDFISTNGYRLKSHVPDITAFVAGTVIENGVMPASVPIALFG